MELVPIVASENDYYTKLQLMMRSPRTSPDVVYEDTFLINSDITAGYLQPLDTWLGKWDQWDQFQDVAKGAAKAQDGKTYGIPDGTDTRALWFNKDLLSQAGLPEAWAPKSWDDILTACREIKGKLPNVTPINVYAGKAAGEAASMQGFEMLFYGTGSTLYDPSKDKWNVGSPEFVDALQFIKTIFDEKLAPDPSVALDAQIGNRVSEEFLPKGQLAIALDGSWQSSNWLTTGGAPWEQWNDVMAQAPMPTKDGSGDGKISMSGGWTWAMTKNASNADNAWNVISTLTSFDNNLRYNINSAAVAVRKDVAADASYTGSNPTLEFFSSLVPVTQYGRRTPTTRASPTRSRSRWRPSSPARPAPRTPPRPTTRPSRASSARTRPRRSESQEGGPVATVTRPGAPAGPDLRRRTHPVKVDIARALPLTPAIVLLLVFLAGPILWCVYAAFTNIALTGAGSGETKFVGLDNFRAAFSSDAFANSVVLTLVFTFLSPSSAEPARPGPGAAAEAVREGRPDARGHHRHRCLGHPEVVAGYVWYAFLAQDGTFNEILGGSVSGRTGSTRCRSSRSPSPTSGAGRPSRCSSTTRRSRRSRPRSRRPPRWTGPPGGDGCGTSRCDDQADRHDEPHAHHAADAVRLRPHLHDDQGWPGTKSQTLPLYMYEQAFSFSQIGYGTAIALVLLAVGAVFSILYMRLLRED